MKHFWPRSLCFLLFLVLPLTPILGQSSPILSDLDIFHPIYAPHGMVASQEKIATEEGVKVLKEGGNAIDAAVTVGFTLAVTLPRAGNLGGGGFMLLHSAKEKKTLAIDYREKAPFAATRDMFLDENGNVDFNKAHRSYLSAGVPGTVAGMILALEKYGTISLSRALAPAIRLAEEGILVSSSLARALSSARARLRISSAGQKIFFRENGENFRIGDKFIQKDLAWSLKQIAKKGRKAFYEGEIAEKIVKAMESHQGIISKEDLLRYEAVIRQPVEGTYRGYQVYSMPPPSSGGIHLIQMLNLLENFPLSKMGHNNGKSIHLLAEVMRLAYADRSKHLGDTDFVKVPKEGLTSKLYSKKLLAQIHLEKANQSKKIFPGNPWPYESNETTHYSVVDRYGNVVSNTYTLNFSYGSGHVVPGTGMLLNNEMDDFSSKPGVPNAYGLVGGEANAIQPEKRMLSSMTPSLVLKEGEFFLVTGSPGGSRIITTTLQIILNVIDHQMNIAEATNASRIHHQWLPDELRVEKGLSKDTIEILEQKGHRVKLKASMGSTQSIMKAPEGFYGASDPRRPAALTLGH